MNSKCRKAIVKKWRSKFVHLSQMARDTLERLNQADRRQIPANTVPSAWPLRLLGAALIGTAASQGLLLSLVSWPSWHDPRQRRVPTGIASLARAPARLANC